VARTIHAASSRGAKPFIEVNCTALPATLMEAELFGHERGAFTDAKESRMGLFEAAAGGFLFLDEVGDLELPLQGKLLKAVEERTVRRVGGIRDRRIDVRILAATNRDLEREAQREQFRRDLYFRLAVIILALPPLRDRGTDVLILAEHYLKRYNAKYGKHVRQVDPRARELLLSYPWPGNVRELSHVIERAVLWSRANILTVDDLSLATPVQSSGSSDGAIEVPAQEADSRPAAEPAGNDLTQWERSLIERAMRESGGNQTKAAQRLGITRDTLRYRLKKFGLHGG
jgi:two-component system, NtrC family, response regulator AtoC